MTAFFRVWRFTHLTSLFSSSRTVSLSALNGGYPNVRLTAKVLPLATSGPPNYLKGFGFKPLSARHETRLCVLMFFNETLSIFDVRVSVASFSFGKRNTTRQLSFTYRLIDQVSGCWLLAKTTDPLHRRTYQ